MRGSRSLLPALLVLGGVPVFAQSSFTSPAVTATTHIFVPITIGTPTASLQFGDVFPGTGPGTVVMSPLTNLRTVSGTGVTGGSINPVSCASVTISGRRAASFSVTLPSTATLTSTQSGATSSLTVSSFTGATYVGSTWTALGNGTGGGSAALLPDTVGASIALRVGGTLTVPSTTLDGDYSGTFTVTVTYN
jgi:Domain of unknown function (DUF4402)